MRRLALALGCLLVFAATAPAQTSIPRMFTYQGVLTAPNGNAVANGPYEVTIRLYATPTGGPALWEETHTITTVNGVFDVVMGRMVPLTLTFDRQYWLAVEIAQEGEMIPGTRLTAVPYALFADRARVADSLTATATGVVRSVNGVDGDLVLEGDGATTIMQTGKKFTISTPKSVQRITSLDGSILVRLTNESDIDLAIKAVDPSTILRAGAQPGEALVWDGVTSACKPKLITGDITDVMRRGDAAGGDLTGTYPNPLIREGAVTTEKIALGAVTRVQESVAKSLVSNGGGVGTSASHQMNGSLGQPVIGVVQRHPKHLEQGFWYAANRIHDANGWHTTVSMPDITGRNGQTITVPISMVSTQKMVVGGVKNWTARVRFNKSMLEPRGVTNLEEAD